MTDRYRDIKQKLCKYAEQDKDIKAVIAIGSSTRSEVPSDEFSDLDLIIVTSAPDRWYSGEYPALLGNVSISFIEPTLGGGKERRCIYDEDRDVDMIIFTHLQFENALKEGLCVQCMHIGSYDDETATVQLMHDYMTAQGYSLDITENRFHHEIYLSDARKVSPDKLKTVIRHPIK